MQRANSLAMVSYLCQFPPMQSEPNNFPIAESSVAAMAARVVERVKNMTHDERVATLVEAGIIREDGSLTPAYGGEPEVNFR